MDLKSTVVLLQSDLGLLFGKRDVAREGCACWALCPSLQGSSAPEHGTQRCEGLPSLPGAGGSHLDSKSSAGFKIHWALQDLGYYPPMFSVQTLSRLMVDSCMKMHFLSWELSFPPPSFPLNSLTLKHEDREELNSYLLHCLFILGHICIEPALIPLFFRTSQVLAFQSFFENSRPHISSILESWMKQQLEGCCLALRQAGLSSSFLPSAAYHGSCFFTQAIRAPVQLHVMLAVQCSCISGSCRDRYGTVKKRTQTSRHLVDSFDHSCTLPRRLS